LVSTLRQWFRIAADAVVSIIKGLSDYADPHLAAPSVAQKLARPVPLGLLVVAKPLQRAARHAPQGRFGPSPPPESDSFFQNSNVIS
jgi:hypothetical protein